MEETAGASKVLPLSSNLRPDEVLAESFEVAWSEATDINSSFLMTTCSSADSVEGDYLAQAKLRQFLVATIQCLIIVFTLLGNGLVVGAVASFHRLRSVRMPPQMRVGPTSVHMCVYVCMHVCLSVFVPCLCVF